MIYPKCYDDEVSAKLFKLFSYLIMLVKSILSNDLPFAPYSHSTYHVTSVPGRIDTSANKSCIREVANLSAVDHAICLK